MPATDPTPDGASPTPEKRVTMRALAERLGVTKTTVSLALRGNRSISESMREQVNKLAVEMNYQRDPAIDSIIAQRWGGGPRERHRVIAFLCHRRSSGKQVQGRYFTGARERAEESGYKLEPFYVDEYPSARAVSRVLYSRGIRGIIVAPINNPESTRAMQIDWSKFTAVCCGVGRVIPPLHTVTSDVFRTTRQAWEVVAQGGFKRIGAAINCHQPVADDDWQRISASAAAIKLLGLENLVQAPFLSSDVTDEAALLQWYETYKPDLIVGFNHATGEMLERNGVRIPEDVELVCLLTTGSSKWSGISHNHNLISRTSVDVLDAEMRSNHWGLPKLPNMILIEPEWNQGTTYRPAHPATLFRLTDNSCQPSVTI